MRLPQIDALRGIAVLLVLGRHIPLPPDAPAALVLWQRCGWVGVDLFFVLSGFLVSGLLFAEYRKTGTVDAWRFLVRRGFKIYPAFWALLGAVIAVWGGPPLAVALSLLFLQNYTRGIWDAEWASTMGHTWSLAVEEHFYLLFAALAYGLVRSRRPNAFAPIPAVAVAVMVTPLVLRIVARWNTPYDAGLHLFPTHLRLDSLMFGVLLSYLHAFHGARLAAWVRPWARWLAAGGVLLVSPALVLDLRESWWVPTFGLTAFYVGFGLVLLAALHSRPAAWMRPLAFVGLHSYAIYLWHLPVHHSLPALPLWAWVAAYVVGSIGVGVVLGRVIEAPFLALRDRMVPALAR